MPCVHYDPPVSCFGGKPWQGWTIVADRVLTDEERSTFARTLDTTWYTTTVEYVGQPRIADWHPVKTIELLKEALPGIEFTLEEAHACNADIGRGADNGAPVG